MSRRRASRCAGWAALLGVVAATGACANRGPAVELTDRLLADERSVYAARTRDADAALRLAAAVPAVLASTCEEAAAARVTVLAAGIENARLSLMARFEANAWTLQWEIEPLLGAPLFATLTRRIDASEAAAKSAATQAAAHPNDARLAAVAATAAAEQAKLRAERLAAQRDSARALAGRIDALREVTRTRIAAAYAPISEQLRAAAIAPCRPPVMPDPVIAAARRAAYAELHSAQVEGLVVLRGGIDRPGPDRSQGEGARETLAAPGTAASGALPADRAALLVDPTASVLDPAFLAELARVERAIRAAERELGARIDASFDELNPGSRPTR